MTGQRDAPTGYFQINPILNGFDFGDGYGGGGGIVTNTGPGAVQVNDATPTAVETAAGKSSLNFLYKHSPTARALIDAIVANGTSLNLITANLAGSGAQDGFDKLNNQILWDPFLFVFGTNSNGSSYTESPLMLLAHELVHAGHSNDPIYQSLASEPLAMQIANNIAAELNQNTGSHFDISRDNHDGQRGNTSSPTSTLPSIVRPGT